MRPHHRRDKDRDRKSGQGQIMVLFALSLVVVIGAAALAIDLNRLRTEAENVQRVANAAALAGVIFLPNYESNAFYRAKEVAIKNGFVDGKNGISVSPDRVTGFGGRLKVTISEPVTFFLGPVLGVKSRVINRSATAEYFQPLQTGAPDNVLGYAPFPTKVVSPAAPEGFYLENKGPYEFKESV